MRQIKHPMSRAIYEFDEDFNVRVTTKDGKTGTFKELPIDLARLTIIDGEGS